MNLAIKLLSFCFLLLVPLSALSKGQEGHGSIEGRPSILLVECARSIPEIRWQGLPAFLSVEMEPYSVFLPPLSERVFFSTEESHLTIDQLYYLIYLHRLPCQVVDNVFPYHRN